MAKQLIGLHSASTPRNRAGASHDRPPGADLAVAVRAARGFGDGMTDYQNWWENQILEACRQSWHRPDLTLEELRAKQLATAKPSSAKSEIQFDVEREAEQSGITTAHYLRVS